MSRMGQRQGGEEGGLGPGSVWHLPNPNSLSGLTDRNRPSDTEWAYPAREEMVPYSEEVSGSQNRIWLTLLWHSCITLQEVS